MTCFCEEQETHEVKLEGDVETDPLWCIHCGCNLEIEDLPVSTNLQVELNKWAVAYGNWIDWEKDRLLPSGQKLEEEHNKMGMDLTEKLKDELNGSLKVVFSPSAIISDYHYKMKWY